MSGPGLGAPHPVLQRPQQPIHWLSKQDGGITAKKQLRLPLRKTATTSA